MGIRNQKFTRKEISEFCKNNNIKLLDAEYQGSNINHTWYCNIHDEKCVRTLDKIKTHNGLKCCCRERKLVSNKVKIYAIESTQNIKLITKKYINNQQKLRWLCTTHNTEFQRSIVTFKKAPFPPCCQQQQLLDKIQQIIRPLGYELLDDEYKGTHHTWHCSKHDKTYRIRTRYQNFAEGSVLKCCANELSSGSNHPNYNSAVSDEQRINDRRSTQNKIWRQQVIKRDNLTCLKCNATNIKIVAHHLDGYLAHPDLRYDPNNGVTLCVACHNEFHRIYGRGNNTRLEYDEWVATSSKK